MNIELTESEVCQLAQSPHVLRALAAWYDNEELDELRMGYAENGMKLRNRGRALRTAAADLEAQDRAVLEIVDLRLAELTMNTVATDAG
jgi:hypothetical protein